MLAPAPSKTGTGPRLYEFAYCGDINTRLQQLADMAEPEPWAFPGDEGLPILKNYIFHTFNRLAEESRLDEDQLGPNTKICVVGDQACFNTGLFTPNFEQIYALFVKNNWKDRQPWYLKGFFRQSSHYLRSFGKLPERASYFSDIADLVFDYRLDIRVDMDHILSDQENVNRLPPELQNPTLLEGSVNIARKKVAANYRLAVPQYYGGRVQLLIPLGREGNKVDVALVISKQGQFYTGHTCLTLRMAYNNARLVAKPNSDWLRPG